MCYLNVQLKTVEEEKQIYQVLAPGREHEITHRTGPNFLLLKIVSQPGPHSTGAPASRARVPSWAGLSLSCVPAAGGHPRKPETVTSWEVPSWWADRSITSRVPSSRAAAGRGQPGAGSGRHREERRQGEQDWGRRCTPGILRLGSGRCSLARAWDTGRWAVSRRCSEHSGAPDPPCCEPSSPTPRPGTSRCPAAPPPPRRAPGVRWCMRLSSAALMSLLEVRDPKVGGGLGRSCWYSL